MSCYLDTNLLVGLLTPDALTERAERFLLGRDDDLFVSDFAAAEFASIIARRVRTRAFTPDEGRAAFTEFDAWTALAARRIELVAADVTIAQSYLRCLDLPLLAPDALHLAMVQRLRAELATFDRNLAAAGRVLGLTIADA